MEQPKEHADVGDVMIARVQEVDESHNVVATMKGVGLRKLSQVQSYHLASTQSMI